MHPASLCLFIHSGLGPGHLIIPLFYNKVGKKLSIYRISEPPHGDILPQVRLSEPGGFTMLGLSCLTNHNSPSREGLI
jgi:hypothetical protein